MAFYLPKAKHWYSTWWGVTILAMSVLIAAALIAFGLLIFNYWHAVKSGQGEALQNNFYGQIQTTEDPAIMALRKTLETTDDPSVGNAAAPIVIVEFVDLKCPYCKQEDSVLQQIISKYGYNVKIITRDFPMESVHEGTTQFAAIASCANEQGGYSLVANFFYSNQDILPTELSSDEIGNMSDSFGLDRTKMLECVNSGRGKTEAMQDYSDLVKSAKSSAIAGTPIFFVNGVMFADANGTNKGYIPLATWEQLFQKIGLTK
ncbi:MAG: thioredoxin domain-containing protein [Patescibacteria group bacterium]